MLDYSKKVVASIEARMTSSRLPGKVLLEAIDGISMLEFMIQRVKKSKYIDDIIVATTINSEDDKIVELCKKLNIKFYRGSEEDVLSRVLNAHKFINSDVIVELTGDCPLIDPEIIDKVILEYLDGEYDYVSNDHERSYPLGLDVQVFSTEILAEVDRKTKNKDDREHVSLYIYSSGEYSLKAVVAEDSLFWPDLRITLDDHGDYNFIRKIIENFYPINGYDFISKDIITYIKNNMHLLKLLDGVRASDHSNEKIAKK
tara:strand:+ start:29648 stop:30421 length:774 start_codon:yes stop_codon:yes gene_type:complete